MIQNQAMFPGGVLKRSVSPKFAMVEKVYGSEQRVKERLEQQPKTSRTTVGMVPNPNRQEGQDEEYVGTILTGTHHDDFWKKVYDGKFSKTGGQDQAVFDYGDPYKRTVKVDYSA